MELYQILTLEFGRFREYCDLVTVITLGPCFCIDVMANYVVVIMWGKIHWILYTLVAMLGASVAAVLVVEIPQAGKSHSDSKDLIKYWKGRAFRQSSLRQKRVASLRPMGCWVGSFFYYWQGNFLWIF